MNQIYIRFIISVMLVAPVQVLFGQATKLKPTVTTCSHFDISEPLKNITPHPSLPKSKDLDDNEVPEFDVPAKQGALPLGDDPAWQKTFGSKAALDTYENFEALRNSENTSLVAPPDSDGDVGPEHYFAMVNTSFEIFNKSGAAVYGPAGNTTIWDGFIGDWTGQPTSDPIVLYDEHADRWFASIFTSSPVSGNYYILVAVSTSSNPTGTYNRYAWAFTSKPDYPKYGIWPDGYYLGVNSSGDDVCVLERSAMLAGSVADMVSFDNPNKPVPSNTTFNCLLPTDCDGPFPPLGTPNYFMAIGDDAWSAYSFDRVMVWEFEVDWTTPANSTFTGPLSIATSAFDSEFNAFGAGEITQPGTTWELDCIPWILMFRPQFRNFGSYWTIVCNHSVDVDGTNHAGVRWYEIRKYTGSWSIHQQGTYSPDADNRWMGSIAMNGAGDIALGYSVSSTTTYPSIRFTGRLDGDPLGTMTFDESSIYAGSNSQADAGRWGDYSMMSVDPVNDHTFWYISEYAGDYGGWGDWVTQVGAFALDNYCYGGSYSNSFEYISNVSIGDIDNGTGSTSYADYTDLSTDLASNVTLPITVTNGNPTSSNECGIWVDWNRDGSFNTTTEKITVSGTPGNEPYTASLHPPDGTTPGPVRMRIRITYNTTPFPCGVFAYGEVEDYSLNVTGPAPNEWVGTYNHYWHNANNWSLGYIPIAGEDVVIANAGFQPVYVDDYTGFANEVCEDLLVEAGANLTFYNMKLIVNGNLTVNGTIGMTQANAIMDVMGHVVWNSGSDFNVTNSDAFINVYGNWNFNAGANANPTLGFVDFRGTSDCWIRSYSDNSNFYNLRIYKSGGGKARFSNVSTQDLVVNNIIFITSTGIFESFSSTNIQLKGNFNYHGAFDFTQFNNTGSFVFDGNTQSFYNYSSGSGIFNNVVFSSTTGTTGLSDMTVAGNVSIDEGSFSPEATTVSVAGNWSNTVGPDGFNEGTGRVIFNGGNYHQYCSNETFNELEVNKASGGAFRMNGTDVVCAAYDWTAGAVDVLTGSFTANDLVDDGIFGSFYTNTGGIINLYQPTGFADLNGNLIFSGGGEIHVYGSGESYIPYTQAASITMSGGVLDFHTTNVRLDPTYPLTTNISGGVIRTSGNFQCERTDFNPTGGTVELYGTTDHSLYVEPGSALFNLYIDKEDEGKGNLIGGDVAPDPRIKGNYYKGVLSSNISLISDVSVINNLAIGTGTLTLNGNSLSVTHDCNVYGTLTMNDVTDVLTVGVNYQDALIFYPGATADLSSGMVNIYGWISSYLGSSFAASTDNTVVVKGNLGGGLENMEPSAVYGNVTIDKNAGQRAYISWAATEPIEVDGNFTVLPENIFEVQNNSLIVHGGFTDDATSEIYAYDAAKKEAIPPGAYSLIPDTIVEYSPEMIEGKDLNLSLPSEYIEMDNAFTQLGLLDVGDGQVVVHGQYLQLSSGNLIIDGGSLICDGPTSSIHFIGGDFSMPTGLLEITNNHLNFSPETSTISGGTIRIGGSLAASSANTFQPSGGLVEFAGTSFTAPYMQVHPSNYFHDLTIDRSTAIQIYTGYDLHIKNDLTITTGGLDANTGDIYLGGNWNNEIGASGFDPGTGMVTFNGTGTVTMVSSGQDFYALTLDKGASTEQLLIFNSINVLNDLLINTGVFYSNASPTTDNVISTEGDIAVNSGGNLWILPRSTLEISDGQTLSVGSGGGLYVLGNENYYATISHALTGHYALYIFSGATIGAKNAIFEYMNSSGVFVDIGATVDPLYPFDYCIFRNGSPAPSSLLTMNSLDEITCTEVYFENTPGTTGFNVVRSVSPGGVAFVDALGDFEGEEFESDPFDLVDWEYTTRTLDLTVFLEGPFNPATKTMDAEINAILPLDQPYGPSLPYYLNPLPDWYYAGPENVGSVPNVNVVDWVLIQLRDAPDVPSALPGTAFATIPAFVLNTGEVVALDGSSLVTFTGSYIYELYVAIWHRNHLGVISLFYLTESGGVYTYDFSSGSSQALGGSSAQVQLSVSPEIWGMMAGDGDGDGEITLNDKLNTWYLYAGDEGYNAADHNLDGQIDNRDKDDYWLPNMGAGSYVPE